MKYYSIKEASELLGIKVRTLREWIKLGKIKAEKAKNKWYWIIPDHEIDRKINADKN